MRVIPCYFPVLTNTLTSWCLSKSARDRSFPGMSLRMNARHMRFSLYISLIQGTFCGEDLAADWLHRQSVWTREKHSLFLEDCHDVPPG